MRYEAPGAVVDVQMPWASTGLTGTLAVRLVKVTTGGADTTVTARHTTLIVENPAGSKLYEATLTLPSTAGDYAPIWDDGMTFLRGDPIRVTPDIPVPAGGTDEPYFTPGEFRARYPENSTAQDLTDDQVNAARATAEEIIEHECHVAFVPRSKMITLSGEGLTRASVPLYLIREITTVTVDDEVVDATAYRIGPGAIYRTTSWNRGVSNVVIELLHGYDAPPRRIKEAAMMLAFHRAVKGPIDDRATSIPAGEAGGTITLLTPGVGNAMTGLPEVDAAIIAHRLPPLGSVSSVPMTDSANTYPSDVDSFAIG